MTECPACGQGLDIATSAIEVTCPACRAPIAVRITPVPDGAFRGGSVRELALVPVPPPDDSVVDRSTDTQVHLDVTRLGLSEGPGRLLVGFGLGSVLMTAGACLALVAHGGATPIVLAVLGLGLLVLSVRGMLRSATISRLRQIRIDRERETLLLDGPGDHHERHADLASFHVVTDGSASWVYAKTRDGQNVPITEAIGEDAAYWVMRRLREGAGRGSRKG